MLTYEYCSECHLTHYQSLDTNVLLSSFITYQLIMQSDIYSIQWFILGIYISWTTTVAHNRDYEFLILWGYHNTFMASWEYWLGIIKCLLKCRISKILYSKIFCWLNNWLTACCLQTIVIWQLCACTDSVRCWFTVYGFSTDITFQTKTFRVFRNHWSNWRSCFSAIICLFCLNNSENEVQCNDASFNSLVWSYV